YQIKGNIATRMPGANAGIPRMLSYALGHLIKDKTTLPPQGTISDFIAIAESTIKHLPDFPSKRLKALRSRVRDVSPEARAQGARAKSAPPQPARIPAGQVFPVQMGNAPAPKKADWMQDFITQHRPAGAGETRLTTMSGLANSRASQAAKKSERAEKKLNTKPDWMSDFDNQTAGKENIKLDSKDDKKATSQKKDDWMKDFQ
ncbi:MAG TPA: hypothetical protein PKZ32_08245, partial [Candidatus Melainabacteria bacterium]|nr:hypothetical protein [Candidatus Melainabacteria bacterium]